MALTATLLDSSFRGARTLARRLADESGISLMLAVVSLAVLSTVGGGVAVYTSSNVRHAYTDQSTASAYHLAEAGLATAMSRLQGADDPTVTTILPSTTVTFPSLGGSATYSGTAVATTDRVTWTITSTGTAGNPQRKQTLKQTAIVRGLVPGADLGSWSRFYSNSTSQCFTIDTVTMPTPLASKGDLCLINGGSVSGASTTIQVGHNVYVQGPQVDSGKAPATASGTSWTNPTYVYSSDENFATYSVSGNTTSNTLTIRNFGFSIPSTAVINGISVYVERGATSSTNRLKDQTIQLQKTSGLVGSNKAVTSSYWPVGNGSSPNDSTRQYGDTDDLWGTTWTPAEINSSNFGVQVRVQNVTSTSTTANIDQVYVYVRYTTDVTVGVGSSTQNINKAMVGNVCQYNGNTAHNPCGTADRVYANTVEMGADDADLVMPVLDLDYWYQNSRPGPKHPCTNTGNNLSPLMFDNDNYLNNSVQFDNSGTYDITPAARSYDCQVIENGVMLGRLAWNYQTHVLNIGGTIFFDGDVRFDDDGQLVHYQGRGLIYAAGDVEFDELVCAGGTGTSQSCVNSMSSWDPTKNYLTLMANGNAEYDQGGAGCSGLPSNGMTCAGIHPQSGFQGVVSAQGTCTIHERFRLSGPVVCGSIQLPYESDGWPTYYAFPSLSELVDGQKYGDIQGANAFEVQPGPVG